MSSEASTTPSSRSASMDGEYQLVEPELEHLLENHQPMLDDMSENDFDMIDILSATLDQITHQLEDKQREIRAMSTEWTVKTKTRLREQTQKLEDQRERIKKQLLQQYRKIDERMNRDASTVRLRDKISFVVGVSNTCVTPALALRKPLWLPLFYTLQVLTLIALRYIIYRSKRWHYFVFDLCYYVNAMVMLFLWAYPSSTALFITAFCLTNGPVAWAVITWRNSLVFHSLDKVTSVCIHMFPPLVTYVIRWMPTLLCDDNDPTRSIVERQRNAQFPALASLSRIEFGQAMLYSNAAYILWQTLYFLFIMVGRREKVESGLRLTSYSWLLNDTHGKKGFIQRTAFIFGEKYKLYMFMLLQLVYNIVTIVPTYYLYTHFWLHTAFLITMFASSVWNGANYYIEVFSRRYIIEIEEKMDKRDVKTE
ncbi:hypothetical protein BDF14DRAFT_1764356 [Spinellus fusiger]|nr:hypothetical protein BDF14DRAFT_1764356 [Spinellus fusiger]